MKNLVMLGGGALVTDALTFFISGTSDVALLATFEFLFIVAATAAILKVMKRPVSPYLIATGAPGRHLSFRFHRRG